MVQITTPEGYIQRSSTSNNGFEYVYNLSDHLGNIRVTYMDSNQNNTNPVNLEIVELNSYYPFGMTMEYENNYVSSYANSVARKFKYNGIEHEEALGSDLYEMDVRHFDAAIARWTGIDPVTHHSMSTYLAFDGNPVYWADPSGADAINEFGHDVYWQGALATTPHNERVNDDCPSCETEEDWQAYYSQAWNTAVSLGQLDPSGTKIEIGGRLSSVYENGRTIYYLDGELMDLDIHDSWLDAASSFVADGLLIEAPLLLLKSLSKLSKFFKGGGDEAVDAIVDTATKSVDEFKSLLTPLDEFDEATTIYRGMTGSETNPSIFFTDNASEAAKYAANGGNVVDFRVSNFALSTLEQSGQLNKFTGIRDGSTVISTEYQFIGENLTKAINAIINK